jgi:P22 coat protein - gene protein 5.
MAVNLHTTYAKEIVTTFATNSLTAKRLSEDYSWSGAQTVRVSTPQTVPMGDYTRTGTSRYGSPVEMQDVVQEMKLTQDKSFSITIDKGNNLDQGGTKEGGKMLKLQIIEQAAPLLDRYVFNTLAHKAGTIVGGAAITKANVVDRISAGTQVLDDAEVPDDKRTLFVSNEVYKCLKHADELMAIESIGKTALEKGVVGAYDNMEVVKVPAKRMPANVNFLIVYKNSATAPVKMNDTKLHQDPPGISGNLLEGRQYYDCFVFGARCMGVYIDVDTSAGKGKVLAPLNISTAGAVTGKETGATVKYTLDGTDPRYSTTVQETAGNIPAMEGDVMKAYQVKEGTFPSAVTEAVYTK